MIYIILKHEKIWYETDYLKVCDVPRGSIVGPLLFILCVNDIASLSHICFSILFADDITWFYRSMNFKYNEVVECQQIIS